MLYLERRKELNVGQLDKERRVDYMEYLISGLVLSAVVFAIQLTSYNTCKGK